ncbi:hypothetical protein [Actinokineospora bangkokensis]|uniref:Uncharacterized protein n=1 Tax=Actinokineospora bangkokensis TaxID=1193682 RepID=A0A1Q9LSY5_9PSEU|nr:hypothetical protein [Actinokineospora bangkokensis]OLR95138.1 hypothetical protein BJP25_07495 [Actinokineospora bangkokensis]
MLTPASRVDVELVSPAYPTPGALHTLTRALSPTVWFTAEPDAEPAKPCAVWSLVDSSGYNGVRAVGRASVHLAPGHRKLRAPVVLADAAGYGPSLDPVVGLTGRGFLDALTSAGYDVVLVGFAERHAYVQANAGVLGECLRRVSAEGVTPLVVGGVGAGGVIARLALTRFESAVDGFAPVYLSLDAPHEGAWIPLILQQFAYFFERFPGAPVPRANYLRSVAAQQLLTAWVPDAKHSGPVVSRLRGELVRDLNRAGGWPPRSRLVGVSCGVGTGRRSDVEPGAMAFDWRLGSDAGATARFQPDGGEDQGIGAVEALLEVRRAATTAVPAFDSAPGGLSDLFGQAADAVGAKIAEEHRSSCFVPAVSAAALPGADLLTPVATTPTRFDAFRCAGTNLPHGHLDDTLTTWVLDQLP